MPSNDYVTEPGRGDSKYASSGDETQTDKQTSNESITFYLEKDLEIDF